MEVAPHRWFIYNGLSLLQFRNRVLHYLQALLPNIRFDHKSDLANRVISATINRSLPCSSTQQITYIDQLRGTSFHLQGLPHSALIKIA